MEFRNVSFKGAGELNFSDYQESANRELIDADGGTNLTVRNSGYSNFYADILPVGRGKVRGILSYYGDSWQLVLRSRSDVMITENGSEEKPFTIADVQNPDNEGMYSALPPSEPLLYFLKAPCTFSGNCPAPAHASMSVPGQGQGR